MPDGPKLEKFEERVSIRISQLPEMIQKKHKARIRRRDKLNEKHMRQMREIEKEGEEDLTRFLKKVKDR